MAMPNVCTVTSVYEDGYVEAHDSTSLYYR
jgi:hypothetical protein